MLPKTSPTSSLSVIELLIMRFWYRGWVWIRRISSLVVFLWALLRTPTERPSPAARLPQEIVEMVISYLAYDIPSLRASSETCRSWYISAFPHLHTTFSINVGSLDPHRAWPKPILRIYRLCLLPYVKNLRICSGHLGGDFHPQPLDFLVLPFFSGLTNVQRLEIHQLDIPSFAQEVWRYFGHFSPTVKSLSLTAPRGSSRHLVFFVSLFQNLEDLSLYYRDSDRRPGYSPSGETPIPLFIPPLRGRLAVWNTNVKPLIEDMTNLFRGIRFTSLDIFGVGGVSDLLRACATTLRVLRLHPNDPCAQTVLDSNLSWNKSLRTLEVTVASADDELATGTLETASKVLKHALSTIRSPEFSRVTAIYQESDFYRIEPWGTSKWPHLRDISQAERAEEASRHCRRFELLREMRKVRDFELVLHADVWGPVGEHTVRMLEEAVAAEKAKKGFDDFSSEPLVTYTFRRGSRFEKIQRLQFPA